MSRLTALKIWVRSYLQDENLAWITLLGDAGARRYYRVISRNTSFIVMDSPIDIASIKPYVEIANRLRSQGILTPTIFAEDPTRGFLLLSDFGDLTYQEAIQQYDAQPLYLAAIDSLIKMAQLNDAGLPLYDGAFLQRELGICEEWYFTHHLKLSLSEELAKLWTQSTTLLLGNIVSQPTLFTHRDYHCRNLMWVEDQVGVLDFQDAVKGPIGYDLISLLKDAYLDWPEDFVLDVMIRYWEKARQCHLPVSADFSQFYRDIEWIGLQRHLKILGIFARLYHRDGKDRYLAEIPRILHYIDQVTGRYSELHGLHQLFKRIHAREVSYGYTF